MKSASMVIWALIAGMMICAGQNTMRGRKLTAASLPTAVTDTLNTETIAVDSGAIIFSGYDKTLRSRKECVFVTNHSGQNASAITFCIEYLDMHGRQLHRERHTISCDLTDGQTRMIAFPAWDKQQVWYYYLSRPVRTPAQATPYKVVITSENISVSRGSK